MKTLKKRKKKKKFGYAVYFYSKRKLLKSGHLILISRDILGNLSKKRKIVPFTKLWDNSASKCLSLGGTVPSWDVHSQSFS